MGHSVIASSRQIFVDYKDLVAATVFANGPGCLPCVNVQA